MTLEEAITYFEHIKRWWRSLRIAGIV